MRRNLLDLWQDDRDDETAVPLYSTSSRCWTINASQTKKMRSCSTICLGFCRMGIPGGVKLFQTRIQAGLGMMVHRNRVLEQALKADRIYRRCPIQSAKASVRIGASGHYPQRT